MNAEIITWLTASPRIAWQADFNYLLDENTYKASLQTTGGLSLFIQGIYAEFKEKNHQKALKFYTMGASKLDPLCLCRLHDIYLGDPSFKVDFDCNKALVYLVFAGIYSQDLFFQGKVVPFKKLKAFLVEFDSQCKLLQGVFQSTNIEEINPLKDLTVALLCDFQGLQQEKHRTNVLRIVESLPVDITKEIMFTLYLNEFRLPWTYVVRNKETLVLRLMQDPEIFASFFESYKGLIILSSANKTVAAEFQTWIQSILFVIDFAALSPQKYTYYFILMPFVIDGINLGFFDGKDLICWLRYFLAYCYEKGINEVQNLELAIDLIEKNIEQSPEGVMYPLREAILLKKLGHREESQEVIDMFEGIYEKRRLYQENSLLYYSRAKSYEKYYGDVTTALGMYKKGAAELKDDVRQETFFFYSYWRIRCARRFHKLKEHLATISPDGTLALGRSLRSESRLLSGGALRSENRALSGKKMLKNTAPQSLVESPREEEPSVIIHEEAKKVFEEMGVPVLSDEEVNLATNNVNKTHFAVIENQIYDAEEVIVKDVNILKNNEGSIQKAFNNKHSKMTSSKGVYIQEKNGKAAVYFLTQAPQMHLGTAMDKQMFPNLKAKLHVAMVIAVLLKDIHEGEKPGFYGNLKPSKIAINQEYQIKLHAPNARMVQYQGTEKNGYYAPEQLDGVHGQTGDIWAFGMILWELIFEEKIVGNKKMLEEVYKGRNVEVEAKGKLGLMKDLVNQMISLQSHERPNINFIYDELLAVYQKIRLK